MAQTNGGTEQARRARRNALLAAAIRSRLEVIYTARAVRAGGVPIEKLLEAAEHMDERETLFLAHDLIATA